MSGKLYGLKPKKFIVLDPQSNDRPIQIDRHKISNEMSFAEKKSSNPILKKMSHRCGQSIYLPRYLIFQIAINVHHVIMTVSSFEILK